MQNRRPHLVSLVLIAVLALAAPASGQTSASATLNGGTLSFLNATPGNVTFPSTTLNGTDQTVQQQQLIQIGDARGNGAGWKVTATSTQFTNGTHSLPIGSVTALYPTVGCMTSVTCTPATTVGLTGTYTLPSGPSAPAATTLFNAAVDTGLGAQEITPSWRLRIPGSARAGNYTSTWTFSLVTAP